MVGLCGGIISGVIVGLAFKVNYFASPVWIVGVLVLLIVGYLKPRFAFVVIAIVVGMILAFYRVAFELVGEDYIRQLYGMEVVMSGKVLSDPEEDEGMMKMKLGDLKFGEGKEDVRGNIYVKVDSNVDVKRDDVVELSGKMMEGFGTYAGYMYKPKIVSVWRPEPGSWVLALRNWFAERIRKMLPELQAQLGLSYLMGMKSGLSEELNENLRVVGLSHIVVASGAHLSILVELVRKLFGRLSRAYGLICSVVFVMIFMAMVGWTPSIMRAGVMAILTLISGYVGRKMAPWRLILMVAALTLMMEPGFALNMGWLLSFASYVGIMMLGPGMCRFFYGERKPGFVASTIMTTVAATVMTLPIILYYYGAVSLISVVANLLILPTLSIAMGLVFMIGVLANVPGISFVVSWCAKVVLDFHIMVVSWFGGMKQFLVEMPVGQAWVFWSYGVIILITVVVLLRRLWYSRKYERFNKYNS